MLRLASVELVGEIDAGLVPFSLFSEPNDEFLAFALQFVALGPGRVIALVEHVGKLGGIERLGHHRLSPL